MLSQPSAALYLASREIGNVANLVRDMIKEAQSIVKSSKMREDTNPLGDYAEAVQRLHRDISAYLVELYEESKMNDNQTEQAAGLLGVVTTLKRLSIRSGEVLNQIKDIGSMGKDLSGIARKELVECFEEVQNFFSKAMDAVAYSTPITIEEINRAKKEMRQSQKAFRKAHLRRVQNGECDPSLTDAFNDIIYNMERMADDCVEIATEAEDNIHFVQRSEVGILLPNEPEESVPAGDFSQVNG